MCGLPVIHSAGIFDSSKFYSLTRTPERTVVHYELEVFNQDGGVSILNGREYPIRRGMLLIACPGDCRNSILPFQNRFIHVTGVDDELDVLFRNAAGVTLPEDYEIFPPIFDRISLWFLADDPYLRASAAAEIYQLLRLAHSRRTQHADAAPHANHVVQCAQAYIEAHYYEPFGVEELACACHVSPPYLHRLFTAHLGITPHTALMRRRLIAAKVMLINGQDTIADIAWKCGFQSASYFSDCFRRHVGMPPHKFRLEMGYQL